VAISQLAGEVIREDCEMSHYKSNVNDDLSFWAVSGVPMSKNRAIDLYLTLLKHVLTDTLFETEPNTDDVNELRYVQDFLQHYIRGSAISMLPLKRLDNLRFCVEEVIARGIRGDLIETGVWRGGATIFMRAILQAYGVTDRNIWVADSFEGLPEPNSEKFPIEAKAYKGVVMRDQYKRFAVGLEEVQNNFRAFGLLDDQVKFLKGWFCDTLWRAPIESIAVLRLDGDYYESTMDALNGLYDKLMIGGYAIVDDYGEDTWTYCRRAVDEFRRARGISEPMIQVDSKCFYWQRMG
jgi:hypothetical protein